MDEGQGWLDECTVEKDNAANRLVSMVVACLPAAFSELRGRRVTEAEPQIVGANT